MNKLTLTACIAVAAAASAFAGPMAMEKNVAPVAAACTWTGFYVGVNAGLTQFKSTMNDVNNWGYDNEGEDSGYSSWNESNTAFIGGGQAGYNYQWRDLVVGIEADFSGLGGANNHTVSSFNEEPSEGGGHENYGIDRQAKIDYMGTIRLKLGISFLDNKAMIYGTAGGAYAHGTWDASAFYYTQYYLDRYGYSYDAQWKGDDWRWGWVAGFGMEYALNCHWSIRGEALYTWLGKDTQAMNGPSDSYWYQNGYRPKYQFQDELLTYRVGLDYKFTGFFGGR